MRSAAADALVVEGGKVLLMRREFGPFRGKWAIPGGFVEAGESAEECCVREAREETGLEVEIEMLLGVFSNPARDPRGTIGIVFLCRRVGGKLGGSVEGEAEWFPLEELPALAFDHAEILERLKEGLKGSK
jgi:8-oxo-dGTP diphosphatase